jgi:hypothetical protein
LYKSFTSVVDILCRNILHASVVFGALAIAARPAVDVFFYDGRRLLIRACELRICRAEDANRGNF